MTHGRLDTVRNFKHNRSVKKRNTSDKIKNINSVRLIKGKEYNLASGTVLGLGDPSWDEHLAAFIKISY